MQIELNDKTFDKSSFLLLFSFIIHRKNEFPLISFILIKKMFVLLYVKYGLKYHVLIKISRWQVMCKRFNASFYLILFSDLCILSEFSHIV